VSGSPDPARQEASVLDAWATLERDPSAQLIDVRTQAEWAYVGVPDLSRLSKQTILAEWQSFPSNAVDAAFVSRLTETVARGGGTTASELYFLCRSGVRSLAAARAMTAAGYQRCRNVTGGFEGGLNAERQRGQVSGWKSAGLPWVQS
jgi:rhodanese-related sulfurtransferase